MIPLDGLNFFDAAMRHMSFSAAAVELNVTASAVSQRIRSLEDALGVQLFERLSHGIKPTEAGQLYLLEIRPALLRLRASSARIASRHGRPNHKRRQLSVDMLPALANARLAPKLPSFYKNFPDVDLRLNSSFGVSDPVRDGFDCCIRYGPGGWPGVDATLLVREHVFPVCAPSLLENYGMPRSAEEIADMPLIHDLMPLGWAEWFGAFGHNSSQLSGPVFSDSSLGLQAAIAGLGVAIGRSRLVEADLQSGRLVRIWPENLLTPFSYWLVRPQGKVDTLVDVFVQWLLDEVLCTTDVEAK